MVLIGRVVLSGCDAPQRFRLAAIPAAFALSAITAKATQSRWTLYWFNCENRLMQSKKVMKNEQIFPHPAGFVVSLVNLIGVGAEWGSVEGLEAVAQ